MPPPFERIFMNDIIHIETERLTLSAALKSYLTAMNSYLSKDWISLIGSPFDEVSKWRALLGSLIYQRLREFRVWYIELCESVKMWGIVGFVHHFDWPEKKLGWNLYHNFYGKGMTCGAALAARRYCETHLNLRGVISCIDPANILFAALTIRLDVKLENTHWLMDRDDHVYRYLVTEKPQKAT